MGFDERFIRMWEYYLALCEAGFATGLSQDHQIVPGEGAGPGPLSRGDGYPVTGSVAASGAA